MLSIRGRAGHPTTDLYFWNSCRPWLSRPWRPGIVQRVGANCFQVGDTLVLLRRDEPAVMRRAIDWPGRLVYLIDDDIDAAQDTPSLPDAYRRKLAAFAETQYDRLIRRADVIVASSDVLAAQLGNDPRIDAEILRLDPYWAMAPADQSHFQTISTRFDIVHLGSASHAGALGAVAPAMLELIGDMPSLRLTYVGPVGLHRSLERHDRIRRIQPMPWPRYRRWLGRQRFHLAIYPLEGTRFDRARSANKIVEHMLVGAAGVYPADWPPASLIGDNAVVAPADPTCWYDSLQGAIAQPDMLRRHAQNAMEALADSRSPATQRQFWSRLLDLDAA